METQGKYLTFTNFNHKEISMTAYTAFLLFWIVFGFFYFRRDKSKDAEREAAHH